MLTDAYLAELLTAYPVLASLPPALRAALKADSRRFSAPDGHQFFDVDDACSQFVLLTRGAIRVVKPAPSGREILLYRVQRGDNCILTVSCLLGYQHYPARGVAEGDVAGFAFSQPLLRN